ncbi:MAG: triose-phosphate isomerase [Flavobacteriales bacterium]|nr:triose-phosphate isomerase [Flavobacteriales bacterium]MBK6945857.1 triose-phosphate isomerase [Flavobacteriales bacterium]MBK7239211.1 triose-phosphate isomerase [Flavobacteriales bacterium]MBK7298521.1 triose-phosphate isomerase [Flavobacteriales bacterium]MBK9536683.1 triose-phosphate isomerase [Flavobacteriales bacterium]
MKTIVAGNWKMHKDHAEALALIDEIAKERDTLPQNVVVVVAPAYPFLAEAAERLPNVIVAAQNCHFAEQGAYTGEVSVAMLKSIGVSACIVGHSERRQYFGETDADVAKKIVTLLAHGLIPIYCCGEREEERKAGKHFDVVSGQMKEALGGLANEQLVKVVVAYEPVWAIGTGLTASAEQAQEMHAHIRSLLRSHGDPVALNVPILYGGSCKPDNAESLFSNADVNGGLIGGAALKASDFLELVRIAGKTNKP